MTEKKERHFRGEGFLPKDASEIIEYNSVETTTDISAPVGERTEVIESTTKSESETDVTEDDESDA